MKKTFAIIGIIAMGCLLTFYQIQAIESAKKIDGLWLVKANVAMPIGHEITARDLAVTWVQKDLFSDDYYHDVDQLIGKTLSAGLSKNTLLTSAFVKEVGRYQPGSGHAITALKFTPEEALCWALEIGEEVMVVQVIELDNGHSKIIDLGAVEIKGIYDHYLDSGKVPTFVLVEGKGAVIKKIIEGRDAGRIELMKKAL